MNGFGPLARLRIYILISFNEINTWNTELAQGCAAKICKREVSRGLKL
ncbi:hypothetical protein SXCC_00169 [Gluconacetobacter sp. SXCC-1]|nr:hypothetical protein SXCC_00169 [Gluconacetobacter sp. SXCC-1]